MPELGSLWYSVGLKDLTDADIKKINEKLKSLGSDLFLNPQFAKPVKEILPQGLKLELDPKLNAVSNEALAKAVEGKVMRVEIAPLLTNLRKALKAATKDNPPEIEVGVQSAKLRTIIQNVLNKQGFLINITTVNDNYTKVVQQKLNGTRYTVKIHADAKEITRSVQASLMQVQSRAFGLQISRDILYRSIDDALGHKRFTINVAVQHDQARKAVQDALLRAQVIGKDQALAYQRLQTGELKAAQAELARLKAAHMGAADAAKAHATASINLGGALGSNIKIAGELSSAMASLYSVHAAKEFLSQVIEIGGELEHQKIAMDTIFGDKGKTSELFGQIKGLARQSPFGVMELTKSVKALSAYGVQYNEIYDTAKRLADISAATSVDINRLILAFGKTKSRGFLDGLEAKQFAYANIPIYEMVRRKLEELEGQAVTTAQVMERMKKREIGFDIVKDVLWDMTDEGGKFYNMQEALAGSVKTSWKLVRDNIELMFGEIAESSVGGALKDVAETLQVLTRNWRAMGTMIGASAAAFGVYKVAVAASNAMMGQANVLALQKATASNKVAAANAMEAASYRVLTQAEDYAILAKSGLAKLNRSLLLSHRALTEAEWDAVLASKAVSNDYILRRIALGRLTQAEIDYLISIEAVSAAEVQTAMRAQGLKVSLASLYATMKAGAASAWASTLNFFTRIKAGIVGVGVSVQKLNFASFTASIRNAFANALTWIRTLPTRIAHAEVSVTRLKLAFSGLGRAMSSIGAFLLNPVTIAMAAIGGLMYAWQKNNEQMEKAKEIGDNIFTKASEGANNLKQTLKEIKPSAGLSDHELSQGIEQLEQAIKDYSPRPLQDINDTLIAQDGHVLTLAERYEALKKKVEEVKAAYDLMGDLENGDVGTMVSDAIKSTGGLLNDVVTVNAKDYTEAIKRRSDAIREATVEDARWVKKAVDAAIKADGEFAKVAAGMKNTAAMFNELASNPEKYGMEYALPEVSAILATSDILGINRSIEEDKEKFESDVQDFIKDLTANIRITWDKEIKDLDNSQKDALAISLKNMLDQAEGVSEEVKMQWAKILEKAFGLDLGFKVDATSLIGDEFAANIEKSLGKELADKVRRGVTLTPEEKAKVRKAIYESYKSVFERSDEDVRRALNDVMRGKDAQLKTSGLIINKLNRNVNATDWQQQILDALGDTDLSEIEIKITGHSDINSFIDEARKGYKAANEAIKELKPILIKAGIDFTDGEEITAVPLSLKGNDIALQAIDEYNKKIQATKAIKDALKAQGIDLDVDPNKRQNSGTPKDEFAEAVKERISLLKKAKSEYESLAKSVGREAASKELADSPIFTGLKANKFLPEQAIPKSLDEYEKTLDELQEKLTAKGLKTKKHRELNVEIEQVKFDIKKARVDEQLNKTKEKIDATIKDLTRKWDFHKQLFELTGDRETSVKLAFGEDVAWQTQSQMLESILNTQLAERGLDVPLTISDEEAKEKLEGTPLYDLLWKPTKEAKLKEEVDLQINVAKAVADAASTADKIKVQEGLRDTAVKEYRASEAFKEYGEEGAEAVAKPFNDKILELKSTMLQLLPVWEQIFGDREYASMKQLEQGMNAAQGIIDNAKIHHNKDGKADYFTSVVVNDDGSKQEIQGNISLLEKLRKAVVSLNKEAGKLNPFKRLADTLKEVFSKPKDGEKGDDPETKLRKLGAAVSEVADMTGSLAGQLAEAFDAIGNDGMAQAMTDVQDVMNTVSNIGKGFAEGGLVGGIAAAAGEAIGWVTKAFQASARHKEALRAIMNETLAQQREYNLLLMQQNLEYKKAATILGEDTYGKAKNAVKVMKDAYKDLQDELAGTAEQQGNEQRKANSSRMFARMFGLGFDEAKAKLRQAYAGLADIEIKTGHKKTGLFGWGKGKDIYSSILDVYPDLIDANGKFNSSLAETIINTRVMSDEDKAAFQNMIDLAEQAEAAYEELNSYMTDIFGELGSSMTDALVSAFANGSDAAEDFYDSVSDMLEALAKQMIYSVTLAPLIEEAQKKMMDVMQNDAMSDEQKFEAWTGILDGLLDDALKQQGVANDLFKKYQDMAAEKGFDIFKPDEDSKSGLSAGIQSVTEDTADLLASYLNAIRADVAMQTGTYWTRLLDDSLPQMNIIAQSQLDTQRQIAENTLRNAVAAEAIQVSTAKLVELNDQMGRSWRRIAERNWGYS